jgi:hypothetical protein
VESSKQLAWAKAQVQQAGLLDADSDYDGELGRVCVEMMEKFTSYRHSGHSAALTAAIMDKLMRWEPLVG